GNHPHPAIANLEILLQSLEGAVLPAMPKAAVIHIKWNRLAWHPVLRSERKSRFPVDELPNEPRRCRPIDTWARSGDPQFAFILSWINPRRLGLWCCNSRLICASKQFPDALLQRTVEEIDFNDLLEARSQAAQTTNRSLRQRHGRKFFQIPN